MARQRRTRDSENLNAQSTTVSLDFQAAPRAAQALRLRRLGWTYEKIAGQCGYANESGARYAIKKANAKIIHDEARALVGWQLDMIDEALQVVMARITANTTESLWAVDRLTPLLKRQADLMGLDTPVKSGETANQLPIIREYPEGVAEAV